MNKWIVSVFLLCLLAACGKDDENTPQSGNNNVNGGAGISFSSNVSASIIVDIDGPSSRAPLTVFEANSQMGIYGIPAIEGGRNEDCDLFNRKREEDFQKDLYNECYTYVPGYATLQTEHPAIFPNTNNAALMLYGYYPYSEDAEWRELGGTAQWAVPWKLNVADMSGTMDYMFTGPMMAAYSKVGTNSVVLNFQHAMGRLDFRFFSTSKEVCDAGYQIKSVTVHCNTGEQGWMSITNGEMSFSPKDLACVYPVAGDVGITYGKPGEAVAKFMFPPLQTLVQKITCKMLDGGANPREYVIYDYKYSGYDISLKAGKTTVMRINFLPKDVILSGPANVDSWPTGTNVDVNVKLQ